MGGHALLQGTLPTQGLALRLCIGQWLLYTVPPGKLEEGRTSPSLDVLPLRSAGAAFHTGGHKLSGYVYTLTL